MATEVIPLGTGSAIPTRGRHLSALALVHNSRVLLFDCGEGTQFRLMQAGVRAPRIEAIFITHLHGDHFFGLPGLLSTLSLLKRQNPLRIVGPLGLTDMLAHIPGVGPDQLSFAVDFVELADNFRHEIVLEGADFLVEARPLEHRVFTAGYRFQEKPKPGNLDVEQARALGVTDYRDFRALKAGEAVVLDGGRTVRPEEVLGPEHPGASFAYVTDTRPCEGGRVLARQAGLLYHDATFTNEFAEWAVETGHSTARQAAEVAQAAGAGRLLLGHLSARYSDPAPLLTEARAIFQNTEVAEELKRYSVEPVNEPVEK
jgi:ribonuclease Z